MEFFFKVDQFPIECPHVDQVKVDVIGGFARDERGPVHHHGVRVRGDSDDGGGWREHRKKLYQPWFINFAIVVYSFQIRLQLKT